jgi:hypothetical protein
MQYVKPWEHLSAFGTLSIIIVLQLESTIPPAAQLLLLQSQQGDLVGHHLRISKILQRISQPSCEPLYATITAHRKQETFIYEYPSP